MKKLYLVLDTETADLTGSVYDVGYVVCNRKGEILREYNALVREVFTDGKRMMGAFYAKKIFSHYAEMLDSGRIHLQTWSQIVEQLNHDISESGATVICAYNAGFDFRVMRNTHVMLGNSGHVLQHKMDKLDLWQFACETKLTQADYIRMARENGWITDKGNIQTGAQFAYRYITRNGEFVEEHTALSDARIEATILAECLRMRKRIPYGVTNAMPWKLVAEKAAKVNT